MIVFLNRESPKTPLVKVARAGRVVMGMPALGMRMRQPAKEVGKLMIPLWPEHEVPVIGHDAIAEEPNGMLDQCFGENAFERLVIGIFLKQGQTRNRTVQGVIDEATRSRPSMACHAGRIADGKQHVNICPRPLLIGLQEKVMSRAADYL